MACPDIYSCDYACLRRGGCDYVVRKRWEKEQKRKKISREEKIRQLKKLINELEV